MNQICSCTFVAKDASNMALTYSSMLELGTEIPDFKLVNSLDQQVFSSSKLNNDRPSLLMVICNHCPYVIHYTAKNCNNLLMTTPEKLIL